MKKYKISKLVLAIGVAVVVGIVPVSASEITGTVSTGVSSGVEGTVIVAPVASPAAGTFTSAQSVTLTATGATSIHYTTDGLTPTCTSGSTYSGAISVGASLVIQALSCYPNSNHSSVVVFGYAINPPATPAPNNNGGGGGGGGGGGPAPTPSVTPTFAQGNSNGDSWVDVLDFNILISNWGQTSSGNPADFNADGVVDILDFTILMNNWTL